MVQPTYNPEEALNRVKLMMGYDSSKTLTENKKSIGLISEQNKWMDSSGNPIDNPNTEPEKAIVKLLQKCNSSIEGTGGIPDAVIAKLAGQFNQAFNYSFLGSGMGTDDELWRTALKTLSDSTPAGNFGDLCALKKEFEDADFGDFALKLVDELDDEELSEVMTSFLVMVRRSNPTQRLPVKDAKFSSIQYFEKEFACVFQTNSNVDMKVLHDRNNYAYIFVKGKSGTTFKLFYDGRIKKNDDSLTGKKLVCSGGKPTIIGESIEKKKLEEQFDDSELAPKPSPTQTQTQRVRTQKPKPKYPPCQNGRYVLGCSSEVVRQVQECLGFMVSDQDGKFGKITQAALQKLGFAGGFTDKDVEKICKKVEEDPALSVTDTFNEPDINPGS
jgi:hypothetical protein